MHDIVLLIVRNRVDTEVLKVVRFFILALSVCKISMKTCASMKSENKFGTRTFDS